MAETPERVSLELEANIPDEAAIDPAVAAKEECSWWSWLGLKKHAPKFTKLSDIAYPSLTGVHDKKHKLDVYVPNTPNGLDGSVPRRPVLVHVHGGGWVRGSFPSCSFVSPPLTPIFLPP